MLLCTDLLAHSLPGSLWVVSTSDRSQSLFLCSYLVRQSSVSCVNNTHSVVSFFFFFSWMLEKSRKGQRRGRGELLVSITKNEKAKRRRSTSIFTSFTLSAPETNAESAPECMQTESTLGELCTAVNTLTGIQEAVDTRRSS